MLKANKMSHRGGAIRVRSEAKMFPKTFGLLHDLAEYGGREAAREAGTMRRSKGRLREEEKALEREERAREFLRKLRGED